MCSLKMKKLGLLFRETLEGRIKNEFKNSETLFIIRYDKLSSPDMTQLRQSLKAVNATLFVVKNTLSRRALKDLGLEALLKFVDGPCGLVFAPQEPVDTSRVLYNFFRGHEQLKLEAGFLKDRVLEKKEIETLACLPSKDVLRFKAVMALKSPLFGLVMVLKANLRKVVWCLEQIKNKKGG